MDRTDAELLIASRDDPRDRLVVERRHFDRQPPDAPPLDRLPAEPVRQLLRGDAVQPRGSRLPDVLEAAPALKRDRERLGEQIARDLRVEHAPVEVGEQPVRPAVVQLAERARIVARGDQKLCVGSGHYSTNAAGPAACYACVPE